MLRLVNWKPADLFQSDVSLSAPNAFKATVVTDVSKKL